MRQHASAVGVIAWRCRRKHGKKHLVHSGAGLFAVIDDSPETGVEQLFFMVYCGNGDFVFYPPQPAMVSVFIVGAALKII